MKKEKSPTIISKVIMITIIFLAIIVIFGYQIPKLKSISEESNRLDKALFCVDNGYFDYDIERNICYDFGHWNENSFECVEEGKCKGRHYKS